MYWLNEEELYNYVCFLLIEWGRDMSLFVQLYWLNEERICLCAVIATEWGRICLCVYSYIGQMKKGYIFVCVVVSTKWGKDTSLCVQLYWLNEERIYLCAVVSAQWGRDMSLCEKLYQLNAFVCAVISTEWGRADRNRGVVSQVREWRHHTYPTLWCSTHRTLEMGWCEYSPTPAPSTHSLWCCKFSSVKFVL